MSKTFTIGSFSITIGKETPESEAIAAAKAKVAEFRAEATALKAQAAVLDSLADVLESATDPKSLGIITELYGQA